MQLMGIHYQCIAYLRSDRLVRCFSYRYSPRLNLVPCTWLFSRL